MSKKAFLAVCVAAWFNENAKTNKVTLVFNSDPINNIPENLTPSQKMRIASAGSSFERKPVRGIWPITENLAKKIGIDVEGLSKDAKNPTVFDSPIMGEDIFGFPVGNQIVETTVRRDGSTSDAKINPSTGEEMTSNGMPIYRYVDVLPLEDIEGNTFLISDQQALRAATA